MGFGDGLPRRFGTLSDPGPFSLAADLDLLPRIASWPYNGRTQGRGDHYGDRI